MSTATNAPELEQTTSALDSTPELTDAQEEKYMAFCDKHQLDATIDAHEQLRWLVGCDQAHHAAILRGILGLGTPRVHRPQRITTDLCALVMQAIVDDEEAQVAREARLAARATSAALPTPTTLQSVAIVVRSNTNPAPAMSLWCANQPQESMRNSVRTRSGEIQLGLAL